MSLNVSGYLQPGQIAPVAQMGQNIVVKRIQQFFLYQCLFVEQIPLSSPMVRDFCTVGGVNTPIAANGQLIGQSLQVPLEMDGSELGQFRIICVDDITANIYQPQNLGRFVLKQVKARLSRQGQRLDRHFAMSEIFTFQDEYPFVDIFNPTQYAITAARLAFFGFRYRVHQTGGPFQGIDEIVNKHIGFAAVMGEGFVGTGYQRAVGNI